MTRLLWCIFLLSGLAGTATAAEVKLSPSLCAVSGGEDSCNITVGVSFKPAEDGNYCLDIEERGLVRCFRGKEAISAEVYVSTRQDLRFRILDAASGAILAQSTLKVARYKPKRHQRRYGWTLL